MFCIGFVPFFVTSNHQIQLLMICPIHTLQHKIWIYRYDELTNIDPMSKWRSLHDDNRMYVTS